MLDIDSCDRVFVADTLNHRIQVIGVDGTVLQQLQCFGGEGVYGMRVATAGGASRLFATSWPTSGGSSGSVRAFALANACGAPKPLPGDCATTAQWTIDLPPSAAPPMLHTIDVGDDGAVYIATLGGNLPPQKWVPANSPR
jgi:hypothetical protein